MTTKKPAAKRKKAVAKTPKVILPDTIPVRGRTVPKLKEALVCIVDEPRRWARTGMAMSALPRFAQDAAVACAGDVCYFCERKQVPVPPEKLFLFHPEYPLCVCLAPLRKMAFDYIENWDSVEGKQQIMTQVEAGKIALDTPVYQYFCQCGEGPVVVDVKTIAYGLRKHQKHTRRRLCNGCYQKATANRTQLKNALYAEASRAKRGPDARINKIKHTKIKEPEIGPLPPFNEVLTDAQLEELDKKALEKVNQTAL